MSFLWEKVDFHCLVSLPECNVQPDICLPEFFLPQKEAFAWAGLCEEQHDEKLPLANLQIPNNTWLIFNTLYLHAGGLVTRLKIIDS